MKRILNFISLELAAILCMFILCEKINAEDLVKMWDVVGKKMCTNQGENFFYSMCRPNPTTDSYIISDGYRGSIFVYKKSVNLNTEVRVQRIDENGNKLWGENGVLIKSINLVNNSSPYLISDGNNGAIIAFDNGSTPIRAQRVDCNGNKQWGANGIIISNDPNFKENSKIVNTRNGFYIVWRQFNGINNFDVYAQRISLNGRIFWQQNGICVSNDNISDTQYEVISDGSGGIIITYYCELNGNKILYSQKIDSNGSKFWGNEGITVDDALQPSETFGVISDTAGGVIIAWQTREESIFSQRIDARGNKIWREEGELICFRSRLINLVNSENGGAIVIWNTPSCACRAIKATRIDSGGHLFLLNNDRAIGLVDALVPNSEAIFLPNGNTVFVWGNEINNIKSLKIQVLDTDGNSKLNEIEQMVAQGHSPEIIYNGSSALYLVYQQDNNLFMQKYDILFNISFERGDFTGWGLSNNVMDASNACVFQDFFGIRPQEGNYMGFVGNNNQPAEVEVVLTSPWIIVPQDATAISYKWKFLCGEAPSQNNLYNDTLTVRLENGSANTIRSIASMRVNSLNFALVNNIPNYGRVTDWIRTSRDITLYRNKRIRFHFAIKNVGDADGRCAVLLDDIFIK